MTTETGNMTEEPKKNNGRFGPGKCGNPGGRPRGQHSVTTALRRKLTSKALADELAQALIDQFLAGNAQAIAQVLNRLDGVVRQEADITSKGEQIAPQVIMLPRNERDDET